ncbi:MAG: FAD-dependent oxidoreductase [Peptococcaceae bacterium]|jgi:fumarate reductase flavoprotein subunit|nr:FAD-dependent oxidoreductase [Peptococcaceae bacterium]MDH7525973.1 FAD-dependent oxidoreductase [Peptococcaceae bacterium]
MMSQAGLIEEMQADIVIIGGGAGGLSAALEARDRGINNVVVLEKMNAPGGNAVFPNLMLQLSWDGRPPKLPCMDDNRIVDGDPRIDPDYTIRTDAYFKAAMEWNHWRGDARLIRTLINKSEEVPEWLKSKMEPEDYEGYIDNPEAMTGKGGLAKLLIRECNRQGVKILCNTAAKKLLKDETGAAAGVLAETKDGGKLIVRSTKVIIATGGFMGDEELMSRYFPNYDENTLNDLVIVGFKRSGDGIKMAFEIGAASDGTVAFEFNLNRVPYLGASPSPFRDFLFTEKNPEHVWVTPQGVRFVDESKLNITNSMYRLPHKTCYILFSENIKEHILNKQPSIFRWHLYKEKSLEEQITKLVEAGQVKIANTWEEIASWIGAEAAVLKETIAEYNSFCEKGHDDWFCKDPKAMIPLIKPPFYASRCQMSMLVTRGPLKVNIKMELLDKNDNPLPGFYAAGVDIGGTDSDTYASSVASHSLRFALSSGRIAAESAARSILAAKQIK